MSILENMQSSYLKNKYKKEIKEYQNIAYLELYQLITMYSDKVIKLLSIKGESSKYDKDTLVEYESKLENTKSKLYYIKNNPLGYDPDNHHKETNSAYQKLAKLIEDGESKVFTANKMEISPFRFVDFDTTSVSSEYVDNIKHLQSKIGEALLSKLM